MAPYSTQYPCVIYAAHPVSEGWLPLLGPLCVYSIRLLKLQAVLFFSHRSARG